MGSLSAAEIVAGGLNLAGDTGLTTLGFTWLRTFLDKVYSEWDWPFLSQSQADVALAANATYVDVGVGSGGVTRRIQSIRKAAIAQTGSDKSPVPLDLVGHQNVDPGDDPVWTRTARGQPTLLLVEPGTAAGLVSTKAGTVTTLAGADGSGESWLVTGTLNAVRGVTFRPIFYGSVYYLVFDVDDGSYLVKSYGASAPAAPFTTDLGTCLCDGLPSTLLAGLTLTSEAGSDAWDAPQSKAWGFTWGAEQGGEYGLWRLRPNPIPDQAYLLALKLKMLPDWLGINQRPIYPNDETLIQAVFVKGLVHQNDERWSVEQAHLQNMVGSDRVTFGVGPGQNQRLELSNRFRRRRY